MSPDTRGSPGSCCKTHLKGREDREGKRRQGREEKTGKGREDREGKRRQGREEKTGKGREDREGKRRQGREEKTGRARNILLDNKIKHWTRLSVDNLKSTQDRTQL